MAMVMSCLSTLRTKLRYWLQSTLLCSRGSRSPVAIRRDVSEIGMGLFGCFHRSTREDLKIDHWEEFNCDYRDQTTIGVPRRGRQI